MASIGFYSALFLQNNLYFDFTENNLQSLSNHYTSMPSWNHQLFYYRHSKIFSKSIGCKKVCTKKKKKGM